MKRFGIALLPMLALLAFVAFYQPATTEAQANVPCYRMQGGAKNVAGSGCEYEFQSGSTLDVQNGATFSADSISATDDLTVTDFYAAQQSAQTITFGGTITPTGMYHQITAAAARGTSSVAGVSQAGRVVFLVNVGSNTITLTDTGTLKLSANIALGQYDSLGLISDGTNWIQFSTSNN